MLSLIFISCGDKLAPKRIDHFMSLIEHEWHMAGDKLPRPMLLEIGTHQITSYR